MLEKSRKYTGKFSRKHNKKIKNGKRQTKKRRSSTNFESDMIRGGAIFPLDETQDIVTQAPETWSSRWNAVRDKRTRQWISNELESFNSVSVTTDSAETNIQSLFNELVKQLYKIGSLQPTNDDSELNQIKTLANLLFVCVLSKNSKDVSGKLNYCSDLIKLAILLKNDVLVRFMLSIKDIQHPEIIDNVDSFYFTNPKGTILDFALINWFVTESSNIDHDSSSSNESNESNGLGERLNSVDATTLPSIVEGGGRSVTEPEVEVTDPEKTVSEIESNGDQTKELTKEQVLEYKMKIESYKTECKQLNESPEQTKNFDIINLVLGTYGETQFMSKSSPSCIFISNSIHFPLLGPIFSKDSYDKYILNEESVLSEPEPVNSVDGVDTATTAPEAPTNMFNDAIQIKINDDATKPDTIFVIDPPLTFYVFMDIIFMNCVSGTDVCKRSIMSSSRFDRGIGKSISKAATGLFTGKTSTNKSSEPNFDDTKSNDYKYRGKTLFHSACQYNNLSIIELLNATKDNFSDLMSLTDTKKRKLEPYNTIVNQTFQSSFGDRTYTSNALTMILNYWKYNKSVMGGGGDTTISGGAESDYSPLIIRDILLNAGLQPIDDDTKQFLGESMKSASVGDTIRKPTVATDEFKEKTLLKNTNSMSSLWNRLTKSKTELDHAEAELNEAIDSGGPATSVKRDEIHKRLLRMLDEFEKMQNANGPNGTKNGKKNGFPYEIGILGQDGVGGDDTPSLFERAKSSVYSLVSSLRKSLTDMSIPNKRKSEINIQLYQSLLDTKLPYLENLFIKHTKNSGSVISEIIDSISSIDNMIALIKNNGAFDENVQSYSKTIEIERQPSYKKTNDPESVKITEKEKKEGGGRKRRTRRRRW
jgi:hypothetical protein